ncbi:MAG TPA: SHOCT domain-containing protein [Acidimicrobiia bacterium]
MRKLAGLRDDGILSEDEFQAPALFDQLVKLAHCPEAPEPALSLCAGQRASSGSS